MLETEGPDDNFETVGTILVTHIYVGVLSFDIRVGHQDSKDQLQVTNITMSPTLLSPTMNWFIVSRKDDFFIFWRLFKLITSLRWLSRLIIYVWRHFVWRKLTMNHCIVSSRVTCNFQVQRFDSKSFTTLTKLYSNIQKYTVGIVMWYLDAELYTMDSRPWTFQGRNKEWFLRNPFLEIP